MYLKIIVFKNLNKNTYYYKFLKGYYTHYHVGYINQYNHEVILIIDYSCNAYDLEHAPLKLKIIEKIMYKLEKLKNK